MHTQRIPTLRIDKDIHRVFGVRVHSTPHPTWLVGADGDEAEIKGAPVEADLREGGADGEVCVFGGVVVGGCGEGGDGAVACVAV